MLKARVIPTLLWKHVGLVKGVGFDSWRRVGPVLPAVNVYSARDVDELVLVDIAASQEHCAPDWAAISDFAEACFVPFTVGGGVAHPDHIRELLRSGADKVTVNSAAYANPSLIDDSAQRFGSQCIVASIDVRRSGDGAYECFSHGGTRPTSRTPEQWAAEVVDRGAGELLLTSVERDGTMLGYDLGLIEMVAAAVSVPVIASGGAGSYEHMRQAIQEAGASAVAAASIFHFTEQTPAEARKYLGRAGIPVRKPLSDQ